MKEAKKGYCSKCGQYFYVHEHHVLPKAIFGNDGQLVKLCPNCHTHFHEYSKKETTDPNNAEDAKKIWERWLRSIPVVISVLAILFLFFYSL